MTNPKSDKPNLDLISMVQQARMQHDADAVPSEVSAVYWIESKPTGEGVRTPTARAGQWVIVTTAVQVDALWALVKQATEAGQLGYKSKVSTAPASGQKNPDDRLIHVRTYDSADATDVQRVGDVLRGLGVDDEAMRYEAK